MGKVAKKGRIFLGKRIGPRSARRARKPLSEDWLTGVIPNRHFVNKKRNKRPQKREKNYQ